MASNSTILTAFNTQFFEFIDDVVKLFPDDKAIIQCKQILSLAKKGNPKLIISYWFQYMTVPYFKQISEGDISFFIEKNYQDDLGNVNKDAKENEQFIKEINRLREPVRKMDDTNKGICMKYIQNMAKLSQMYFQTQK
tara:strand:+ start:946 stop:1359 length:414 start_codon:yes stop_codon:yes gene_type:complete